MDVEALTQLFAYCERGQSDRLSAEPVNVLTNLAFLVAAILAGLRWRAYAERLRDRDVAVFIALMALIGLGSAGLHVFAAPWAILGDVLPIALFILAYLNFALIRFLGLPPGIAMLLVLAFLAMTGAMLAFPAATIALNGSTVLLPALGVVMLVGGLMQRRRHPGGAWLLSAAGLFAIALVLRTIDHTVCDATIVNGHTFGTHAGWHVVCAVVLYLLVRAAMDHGRHGEQVYEVLAPVGPRAGGSK
ncbi:MAG: ceramidase domain-containing protein [Pseudomonadota bacterium]